MRVFKNEILILRVLLQDVAKLIDGNGLANLSTFAPDLTFRVGDSVEGFQRVMRSHGVA